MYKSNCKPVSFIRLVNKNGFISDIDSTRNQNTEQTRKFKYHICHVEIK